MKLITLNLWGGVVYNPLIKFIKKHAVDTDIFCFQEMVFGDIPDFTKEQKARINLFAEISNILSDFESFIYLSKAGMYFGIEKNPLPNKGQMGQAIFVRKGIKVISEGGIRLYKDDSYHAQIPSLTTTGNMQYIEIEKDNNSILIGNIHGLWQEDSMKLNTPERIEQTERIMKLFNQKEGKKILCGDFNMKLDIKAMQMIEKDLVSLIRKHNIKSTRTSYYLKPEQYSDYIFISSNIFVKKFEVSRDEVSDHSALLLDFN